MFEDTKLKLKAYIVYNDYEKCLAAFNTAAIKERLSRGKT